MILRVMQQTGRRIFELADAVLNPVFGNRANPLYNLGALSFYFFWIVAVSGIYIYIFFETSIEGAYQSVEHLTHKQWYLGGIMRSLHRYASDALVITMALHLIREFAFDRYRSFHWFSWLTGVPILWLVFASGINGYWLVWDELAQYIAILTSEWLDFLPIFTEPMARNFLSQENLSDRLFSLLAFLHIGIPLSLLFVIWIHVQRVSMPKDNPPRRLAIGVLIAFVALALIAPATSHAPANLDSATTTLKLDWFYLFMYPLLDKWSVPTVWLIVGAISALLIALPWLPRQRPEATAVIDLDNCNGCGRCFVDCPYGAVAMQTRTDDKPYEQEAIVDAAMCASCGICVGSCPTASPFRRASALVAGIELPQMQTRDLRQQILSACEGLQGTSRILVFGCQHDSGLQKLAGSDVAVIKLPCIGALPPAFLDFIITRRHADGVVLSGCKEGNCYYRFGIDWTKQRLSGERDPQLRQRVPRQRLLLFWDNGVGLGQHHQAIDNFRQRLEPLGRYRNNEQLTDRQPPTDGQGVS